VVTPPAIFMVKGFIDPYLAGGIDVAGPHNRQFVGSHAC
jgi:hypothetical protein